MVESVKNILKVHLLEKLRLHHTIYRLPAIGEYLEELISDTLKENGMPNDWKPQRTNSPSKDFTLNTGETFSIKSGLYNIKNATLKFSGSRLGKHSGIDEMVKSIKDNHADYYICVAKNDHDWSPTPELGEDKTYYLFVFDSALLDYSGGIWNKVDNDLGYKYVMDIPGMHARIVSSMSHQLWTTVDLSVIGDPEKLVV
jgi:hypothetical protein